MAEENIQNFFDLLQKSQIVLIALAKNPSNDAIGSALALSRFLSKQEKEVEIVCDSEPQKTLSFLSGLDNIRKNISKNESFVISVNTESVKLDELSYHTLDNRVDIYLQAQGGQKFKPENISFNIQPPVYDLIICLDTPSLEQLGDSYSQNASMFLDTPKINIDNHIANEGYGNVNIIEVTAAATSEIIFELLKRYENGLIDVDISTSLLTGIISATNSFQKSLTTHNSFLRASELIGMGAEQQEIVKNLFKTRSFSMLKLWGRAMARIKILEDLRVPVYFSVVTAQDAERSAATTEDARSAFYELIANLPDLKILFFAFENKDTSKIDLYFYIHPNFKFIEAVNEFGAEQLTDSTARAQIDMPIQSIEEYLVKELAGLKDRLGI
jgi:nanoRNase/pAp phosphatase (c-di-AMP/oligoRNAs hydrolase)